MTDQRSEEPLDLVERGGRSVEEVLEHSRMLRRMAGKVARIGGWSVEVPSDEVRWSEEMFEILEWDLALEPNLDHGLTQVYRDPSLVTAAVSACATDGTPFDVEVEARTFTGRSIWVRVAGEPQLGPDGAIARVVGAFQDITVAKRAAQEHAALGERLRITLDSISDGFFTLDEHWRFTYVNSPVEALTRRDRTSLLGCSVFDAFPGVVGTVFEEAYHRSVREQVTVTVEGEFHEPLNMRVDLTVYPSPPGLAVYFRDATERLEREQRLTDLARQEQEAADRLRELDRIKNAFLSAVSHELRTPLTVVQGMGQSLQRLRGALSESERDDLEDALVTHADRLAQLLEDLLDVDRLTNGAVVIEPVEIDAAAIVRHMVEQYPGGQDRVLEVPDRLVGRIDPIQFERIVVNLLENADKYAPGGQVRVRLERFDVRGIAIEVHDEGPGIAVDDRSRVFEPFYRSHDDLPKPGTGVGLAMVAAFAELHGGEALVLDSASGAHLRVELPGPGPATDTSVG